VNETAENENISELLAKSPNCERWHLPNGQDRILSVLTFPKRPGWSRLTTQVPTDDLLKGGHYLAPGMADAVARSPLTPASPAR